MHAPLVGIYFLQYIVELVRQQLLAVHNNNTSISKRLQLLKSDTVYAWLKLQSFERVDAPEPFWDAKLSLANG